MSEPYFEPNSLLAPPTARAAYSDRTAWLMAKMSAIAYESFEADDSEHLRELLATGQFKLVEPFNIVDKERGVDTQAILARMPGVLSVLAFRGTTLNFGDILTDIRARFITTNAGKAHVGFITAFEAVEDDILRAIREKLPDDEPLYVTGHSLGGALATVAAQRLDDKRTLAACYTFGSPRIGTREWVGRIKVPVYRVVNASDGVPLVPFTSILLSGPLRFLRPIFGTLGYFGYRHVGDFRYLTVDGQLSSGTGALFERLGRVIVANVIGIARFDWTKVRHLVMDHRIAEYVEKLQRIGIDRNS